MSTAKLNPNETVLEIGPGEGFLTEALLKTGARVVAIEKDDQLIGYLESKFAAEIKSGQLKILHQDILGFDAKTLGSYKLVANIPYYLTGQILRQFLSAANQPSSMTLLVQKEVAERIARDSKESLLSVSVKVYGEPRYVKTVPAGAFAPAPKVASAILHIANISREKFKNVDEAKFFEVLKLGFVHKRKMLKSNLDVSGKVLKSCGIAEKARAENVTLEQWLCLSKNF